MRFLIGIGNPGRSYDRTRHNVGFRAVDVLAGEGTFRKDKGLSARICETTDALLVKPETFVNRTGETVRALGAKWKARAEDILVLCDDANLVFGKLRFRPAGSAGGHHGLESVIEALGTNEFARLRIGIGSPDMPAEDLAPFVLSKFGPDEEKELPKILEKVSQVCEDWVRGGADAAMQRLGRVQTNK